MILAHAAVVRNLKSVVYIRGGYQSTLDRLFKKGLLKRDKQSHAFKYRAAKQRKAFIGELIQNVTQDYTLADEDSLLTAFVSLSAEMDNAQLNKLDKLIQDYRATRSPQGKV